VILSKPGKVLDVAKAAAAGRLSSPRRKTSEKKTQLVIARFRGYFF